MRVRVQTWPSSSPVPRSLNLLVGKPLLPKLYAGLPVTIGFSAPALAVYYTTYDGMCHVVPSTLSEIEKKNRPNRALLFISFGVPVPYSCETLLGSHAISVCVPHREHDGTEPQLDAPSAGVFAVRADR